MKKKFFPLTLSFLLILGYLILNKKALYAFVQPKLVPPSISLYKQEVRKESDKYAAANIFDKGYVRETSSKFYERLTFSPEETPLVKGCFAIPDNSSETIVKIALPEGFRDGMLRLYNQAASEYSIGISYDLDNWEFSHYPGYSEQLMSIISLKKEKSANEAVYVKFVPERNESLSVCFSEFQYTSSLPYKSIDYGGRFLLHQIIDVDYDGKIIYKPSVTYEEYQSKKNL